MMKKSRYFEKLSKEKYPVGKLSPNLRKALHLDNDMLPIWIYRMRIVGYPPVWMKEAEMSTTLNVIDNSKSPNDSFNNPFAPEEDGEIEGALQYNKDSLIEFPGFNSLPENLKDDWLIVGMPPYQRKQQLSEAVKSMNLIEPIPYKKSKLDTSDLKLDDSSIVNESSNSNISNDEHKSNISEEKLSVKESTAKDIEIIDQTDILKNSCETKNTENINDIDSDTSNSSGNRKLKVVSLGTPVPSSIKPNLPSLEKWSVGMGELLYFENLPTSTGAYKDKMKGILDKVRKRFAND